MRITSKFSSRAISAKDILKHLAKPSGKPPTTEEFLGVKPQPANTCPFIDSALETLLSFQKDIKSSMDSAEVQLRYIHSTECHECNGHQAIDENIIEIKRYIDVASENWYVLEQAKDNLEAFRKECEKIRSWGEYVKESLWDFASDAEIAMNLDHYQKELEQLYSSKPYLKICEDVVKSNLKKLEKPDVEIANVNKCDECGNYKENERIEGIIDELVFEELTADDKIKKAYENYDSLVAWSDELFDFFSEAIKDKESSPMYLTEQKILKYVAYLNESILADHEHLCKLIVAKEFYSEMHNKYEIEDAMNATPAVYKALLEIYQEAEHNLQGLRIRIDAIPFMPVDFGMEEYVEMIRKDLMSVKKTIELRVKDMGIEQMFIKVGYIRWINEAHTLLGRYSFKTFSFDSAGALILQESSETSAA